jgi:hypothetical protein
MKDFGKEVLAALRKRGIRVAVATHKLWDSDGKPTDAWYLVAGFARDGELYRGWRDRAWFPTQAEAETEARRLFAKDAVLVARSAGRVGSTFEPSR